MNLLKHKKMFCIFLSILFLLPLSGCDSFKLIEKVDDSDKLGNVENEENTDGEEKTPTKEIGSEDDAQNFTIINGISFKKLTTKEMYILKDTGAYQKPDEDSKKIESLNQGDKVERTGISKDGAWSIIKSQSGIQIFVLTEKLSSDKVKTKEEEESEKKKKEEDQKKKEEEQKNQENNSNSNNGNSNNSTTNNQNNSNNQTPTVNPKPVQPPTPQGGIAYPSNPTSTSINFGVTFADENFTAKVVAQVSANTGPDRALPSTGYEVIQWFYSGDTVQVTGIGENGYIRVSVNGQVGFINNKALAR